MTIPLMRTERVNSPRLRQGAPLLRRVAGRRDRALTLPQECGGVFPGKRGARGCSARDRRGGGGQDVKRGISRVLGSIGKRLGGAGIARPPPENAVAAGGRAGPGAMRRDSPAPSPRAADLVSALTTIDGAPASYIVNITTSITLTPHHFAGDHRQRQQCDHQWRPRNFLDGGNLQRGFFVYQGTVAINDLTIQHTAATAVPAATAGAAGAAGWAGPCSWPAAPVSR